MSYYDIMKKDVKSVCDTGASKKILVDHVLGYHFSVSREEVERAVSELIDEGVLFYHIGPNGEMQDFIRPSDFYPRGYRAYKEYLNENKDVANNT